MKVANCHQKFPAYSFLVLFSPACSSLQLLYCFYKFSFCKMDFDMACAVVQGRLRSLEKKIEKPLVEITSSSEFNDDVELIIEKLEETLKEIDPDDLQLKKVHVLLFLNTDFANVKLLEEDKGFCHVFGAVPRLSRYLYFALVTRFKWHVYFRQLVLNFPEIVVFDLLESIQENLKSVDLDSFIPFYDALVEGVFTKILQIQSACKFRTQKFVKLYEPLIKFSILNKLNDTDWEVQRKSIFLGYLTRMYLNLTEKCIKQILNLNLEKDEFYKTDISYSYSKLGAQSCNSNWGYHCLRYILEQAVEVVKGVTVDIYISWVEVEVEDALKSLQMSVRESAFFCQESLRLIRHLYQVVPGLETLDKTLEPMSVRPITEDEEISQADVDTILVNLFNPKRTQVKWLRGLIERGVFESATFMKVVTDNSALMDYDTALMLLRKSIEYIAVSSVEQKDVDLISSTVTDSINSLRESDQILILERFCILSPNDSPLLRDFFHDRVTDFFNKLVKNENKKKQECMNNAIALAIESKDEFLTRALEECLTSKAKTSIILEVIQKMPSVCRIPTENGLSLLLSRVLRLLDKIKGENDKSKDNFIHLVKSLCEIKLLDASLLLNDHLIPIIVKIHEQDDWAYITFYLDIIETIQAIAKLKSVKFISLIAKTLNTLRPRVQSFKPENVESTEKCINILVSSIQNIIRTKTTDDNEIADLRELGESLNALTWHYMLPLWKNWNKDLPIDRNSLLTWTRTGFGHGESLPELKHEIRARLVTSFVKILPQLTAREWEMIGGVNSAKTNLLLATYAVLADCVLIMFQVPFMLKNIPLLSHNLTCFLHFTQKIVMTKIKKFDQPEIDAVVAKLDQIMSQVPEELSKTKMAYLVRLKQEATAVDKMEQ